MAEVGPAGALLFVRVGRRVSRGPRSGDWRVERFAVGWQQVALRYERVRAMTEWVIAMDVRNDSPFDFGIHAVNSYIKMT